MSTYRRNAVKRGQAPPITLYRTSWLEGRVHPCSQGRSLIELLLASSLGLFILSMALSLYTSQLFRHRDRAADQVSMIELTQTKADLRDAFKRVRMNEAPSLPAVEIMPVSKSQCPSMAELDWCAQLDGQPVLFIRKQGPISLTDSGATALNSDQFYADRPSSRKLETTAYYVKTVISKASKSAQKQLLKTRFRPNSPAFTQILLTNIQAWHLKVGQFEDIFIEREACDIVDWTRVRAVEFEFIWQPRRQIKSNWLFSLALDA